MQTGNDMSQDDYETIRDFHGQDYADYINHATRSKSDTDDFAEAGKALESFSQELDKMLFEHGGMQSNSMYKERQNQPVLSQIRKQSAVKSGSNTPVLNQSRQVKTRSGESVLSDMRRKGF